MQQIKSIEAKADQASQLLLNNRTQEGCDIFLDVWEDLKDLMQQGSLKDIEELQAAYPWTDFITNWVQDIEQELHNAGIENQVYFNKRIQYCEELLARSSAADQLMIENTRRAIADSHYALGHSAECDRLYQAWLNDDPTWGWGYIGWSDCYRFGAGNAEIDLAKAERIISQALAVADLHDRADVIDRAIEIYTGIGDEEKATELQAELEQLLATDEEPLPKFDMNAFGQEAHDYKQRQTPLDNKQLQAPPVRAEHIGRNDPCPCGSGKKYKKCCGK